MSESIKYMKKSDTKVLLLYLLKQLEKICEEGNITYYAYAGTLLGSVRHGGLIPWDDDIDVVIDRKDYDAFVEASKKVLVDPVVIHTRENDPYFCQEYIKLCFKDDILGYSDISIDVFVLDETNPKRKLFRALQNSIVQSLYPIKVYKISRLQGEKPYKPKNKIKHLFLAAASLLPLKTIEKLHKKTMTAEKKLCTHYVIWGSHYSYKKVTFDKNMWKGSVSIPYENTIINAAENYKDSLLQMYGKNYMQLPPEDKRVDHGVRELNCSALDFEKIKQEVGDV